MSTDKIQIATTKIEGVKLVRNWVHNDDRGYFSEIYNAADFVEAGLPANWVQDNVSVSHAGVIRGMHLQRNKPQGKLIRCLHGTIVDVWVDVRPDSPTFKKWEIITLRGTSPEAVYIPPGLAHGFLCLSPVAIVHYKCTTLYDKASDGGIRWDDAELGITWPYKDEFTPTVSPKDMNLPTLREYLETLG